MLHINNLGYMGVYKGPIKGQMGLNKGQQGQISHVMKVGSATHYLRCVFPPKNDLAIVLFSTSKTDN